jgi:hypothetical protein
LTVATCQDIAAKAMQRLRLLSSGESPTGQEAEDIMLVIQSMYDTWISDGLFGRMNDTVISGNYTAQEQDRVINDGGYTVTLPITIQPRIPSGYYYGDWPDNGLWSALQTSSPRPPRDLSLIAVVASGATTHSIYDARLRAWVKLDGLALTDIAPLSNRGFSGLASIVAEKIADDFGASVTPGVQQEATSFRWGLSSRYSSQRVEAMQDYF